eukprot:COSAG03_NODE_1154_length_4696_cov_5.042854_1_plen_68_part_00
MENKQDGRKKRGQKDALLTRNTQPTANDTSCDIVRLTTADKTSVAHIGAMSAGATIAWLLVASLALY